MEQDRRNPVPVANPPTVLVGICGGIAAYKAADLVSRLVKEGYEVNVQLTGAATRFISPLTFAALTGKPALTSMFPEPASANGRQDAYPHLYPATRADAFILVPATADAIGKVACGLATDLVTTSALSLPPHCLRIFAPAMNVEMWNQPVVRENCAKLAARGWMQIGPETGTLACGMEGEGRLASPTSIIEALKHHLEPPSPSLSGKNILILSGPTHEYLDPVRYIGNASSGKMGKALAETAAKAGATVTFITGPVPSANLPLHPRIAIHSVVNARDMLETARTYYPEADIAIFAAAVADYRPATVSTEKLPKSSSAWSLELEPNPDIAATLNATKRSGQIAIGFALQTGEGIPAARTKLAAKSFDAIVLNNETALGAEAASYHWISAHKLEEWPSIPKTECATRILARAASPLA
ncbi:MAG TPA: bifunctional phosphopantothenoylcysteine decarboxylase/phosphopantothenate--cysteine ligase CoaBC [Kiritimatiellia bacterium]|nr:bifunctional phosphopantothenoylcysteine decarboxylase/phosphopantothenate--cysteine ligase CoaBC [Kiritimatiellia bacterium]